MEVIRQIDQLQQKLGRIGEKSIGLIETKGILHQGHASLIRAARMENKILVVTSFPFEKSEINKEAEVFFSTRQAESIELASLSGADFLFCPEVESIYKKDSMAVVRIKSPQISQLNGQYIDYAHK